MPTRALVVTIFTAFVVFSVAFAGNTSPEANPNSVLVLAKAEKKSETGAFLGIVPEEVTSDVAADYGVAAGQGVLVGETVGGSPAFEAGLRSNDVITMINSTRLTGPAELRVQLAKFKDGDDIKVTYMRGGKERTANVKLTGRDRSDNVFKWSWDSDSPDPEAPHAKHFMNWGKEARGSAAFAGIVTQELSDGLKSYFKVEGGALISEVVEKSPAEKAGLKAGDIIIKIGSEEVDDQGDVSDAIRDMDPDQTVDFHIMREGKSMVLPVTLTNRKDFYGDASDGDSYYLGFGDKEAKELEKEMAKLNDELRTLGIELESLPDVKWEMKIDADAPRVFIGSGEARAIRGDQGWWTWSFKDLREKAKTGIEVLKEDLNTLKSELKQLQTELKDRMSLLRGVWIEVLPQA